MSVERRASRRSLPCPARAKYNRLSAVHARAYVPSTLVGDGYNEARGRLWLRFQPGSTPPTAKEFESAMVELYDMLRGAGMRNGVAVGLDDWWELVVAKCRLDDALELAGQVGLREE